MLFAPNKMWFWMAFVAEVSEVVRCSVSRAPSQGGLSKKAKFFDKSRRFDFDKKSRVNGAVQLEVGADYDSKPTIKTSSDSLETLCELLSTGEKVAIINAASAVYVCGGFFAKTGKGSQEEALASVTCGLGTSLLHFAGRDRRGRYEKSLDGKIKYERDVYKNAIFCSEDMHLKIEMKIYRAYLKVKKNYRFFSDYLAENFNSLTLLINQKYTFTVYSMAALDSRKVSRVDYKRLYRDVYNRLATALMDAKLKGIKHMVLTVPGSGVFSNNDAEYKKTVERAAKKACSHHGRGFNTITICS